MLETTEDTEITEDLPILMKLNLKQITIDDLPFVVEQFKEAAKKIAKLEIDHWQYWVDPPKEKVDWVIEGLEGLEFYYVQKEDGEQIGMLRIMDEDLIYWGPQADKARYVHSLAIKEKFNGKGLGKVVLDMVAKEAGREGCKYLRLDCDSKNSRLCNYYLGLGFEQVGQVKLEISTYNLYQKEV